MQTCWHYFYSYTLFSAIFFSSSFMTLNLTSMKPGTLRADKSFCTVGSLFCLVCHSSMIFFRTALLAFSAQSWSKLFAYKKSDFFSFFGSVRSSKSHDLRSSVRSSTSGLSRALNLHHLGLSQVSTRIFSFAISPSSLTLLGRTDGA